MLLGIRIFINLKKIDEIKKINRSIKWLLFKMYVF